MGKVIVEMFAGQEKLVGHQEQVANLRRAMSDALTVMPGGARFAGAHRFNKHSSMFELDFETKPSVDQALFLIYSKDGAVKNHRYHIIDQDQAEAMAHCRKFTIPLDIFA